MLPPPQSSLSSSQKNLSLSQLLNNAKSITKNSFRTTSRAANRAFGGIKRDISCISQKLGNLTQSLSKEGGRKLENINKTLQSLSINSKTGEKKPFFAAVSKKNALREGKASALSASETSVFIQDEELNRKAIEIFGPKSWKAVLDSPQAEDIKGQVRLFIKKREKVLKKTENIQFRDTPLKKFLDKLTLDSFQQMREMKRCLYNLRGLLNKVRKVDKEGQQLAYLIHAIVEQENIRSKDDLSGLQTGTTSPHTFEPGEILFLLKHDLKRSLNPKDQELFDKFSVHGESLLEKNQAFIEVFNPDEMLRLMRKKMIIKNETNGTEGEWLLNYPKTRQSDIIKSKNLLEASNYKPLMDDLEAYKSLQKKYSIAGSTNLAEITKRVKKGVQTPRAILNVAGSLTKSGAKTGGVVEATTFAHPILGPISIALGTVNILGNALNTVSDLIQLKQSQSKRKVAKAFYEEYQNDPKQKELAAVAKRLKSHHNYRDDVISAFVHSNKTLLAVAGVVTGAVIFGLSIAGSALSMGIAAPILGAIGGTSLSLTVGLISYKLSVWANREIRSSRWKKPHQQLEQLKACKHELTALQSNPDKILDANIYKNDPKYKALLEKSEAYEHYINAPRNKNRLASKTANADLIAKEALIFSRMQRLEAALPQGAWFDKMIGSLQKAPLMGRAVKIAWGGPHLEKVSTDWNKSIEQGMQWVFVKHQKDISQGENKISLSDYERGLFRMHPAYSKHMATLSSQQPFLEANSKEEKLKAWEDQAVVLLAQEELVGYLAKTLEEQGLFKEQPTLQEHVSRLILNPARSTEETNILLATLQTEGEKLEGKHNSLFFAKNYQIFKNQALQKAEKTLSKEAHNTLFGEKIINDLNTPESTPSNDLNTSDASKTSQTNFNIQYFEQGSSKNRFSKNDAVHEYIHLRSISHSNGLSVETMVIHLKQEQILNKTHHFHEITKNQETPWTNLLTQLGASKQDLQAILRSNNDNISQNLLSKIVLRN